MPKIKHSKKSGKLSKKAAKASANVIKASVASSGPTRPAVWRPGQDGVEEGETLEYDPTAYDCLHAFTLEWPCLSFDLLRDELGAPRTVFPHTLYMVAGTQAEPGHPNSLVMAKLSDMGQGRHGRRKAEDSDAESDDSDDDDDELPNLHSLQVSLPAAVNRVRAMPQRPGIVAAWLDNASVQVYDMSSQLLSLKDAIEDKPLRGRPVPQNPLHSHSHAAEGFALDWSPKVQGLLASGDMRKRIHVWLPQEGGGWAVGQPLRGHEASVEDIQWSPTEDTVFVSGSVDRTVRVWDNRIPGGPQLTFTAHATDVNVLSWNRQTSYLLASGADDGVLRVWDLRHIGSNADTACMANYTYHKQPITSVQWCPHEPSMLAASAGDQQVTLWDLAVERDPDEEAALAAATNAIAPEKLPPQLLFVHSGQNDMKEVQWHPQIPGMLVSTALDGFNVFKPENAGNDVKPMET